MIRANARPFFSLVLLLAACGPRQSGTRPSRPAGSGIVITAEDIERLPGRTLEQILIAHVPGLSMGPGSDGRLVLRLRGGSTSIMGSDEALVVVNGIPLGPNQSGNLTAINPQDIESIVVLRDAASTAQYGARGANGVIIIRTKRS